jgi:hypothetical protein
MYRSSAQAIARLQNVGAAAGYQIASITLIATAHALWLDGKLSR